MDYPGYLLPTAHTRYKCSTHHRKMTRSADKLAEVIEYALLEDCMGRRAQKLELTWFNKDQALIPAEEGKYGYTWVDPKDPVTSVSVVYL